jgi:hypothetical protein
MRKHSITRNGLWNAARAGGVALLLAGAPCWAQSAKVAEVAAKSVKITADLAKKEVAAGFRLVDAVDVTSVTAIAEGVAVPLPATWEAWEGAKSPACAWMIVVDTSNPARAKTIEACKDVVRGFLTGMPKTDAVAIYGLARDLEQVMPFETKPEDVLAAISTLKADGDASKTTLIYQNLREALPKLVARTEPRKAILLLTDGKDETRNDAKDGGAAAQEIEKTKLIDAAKAAGVVIHCLGYAEKLDDQKYFGALKEIAMQTEGLFSAASVSSKELDKGVLGKLRSVMHGAGVVHVDVSKLEKAGAITVTAKTANGSEAVLKIPVSKVAEALGASPADLAKLAKEKEIADKAAADKLAKEKEIADKAAADKLAEEKKTADNASADKLAKEKEEAERIEAEAKTKAAEEKKRLWIMISSGVLLIIILAAILMVRASRQRAAEQARLDEAARMADEERSAEDARRAEAAKRAEETKKADSKPLAWLEMCDAQQTRHPVRIPSLKIGRGQHNDFVLRNDSISGNHCVLNCNRDGMWSVTDLNSGNGVVLNGERVQQAELRHGDTIELGELKMRFLLRA